MAKRLSVNELFPEDILWFLQYQYKDDSMEDEIDSLISQRDPSVVNAAGQPVPEMVPRSSTQPLDTSTSGPSCSFTKVDTTEL